MSAQHKAVGSRSGPGNKQIVSTLLEWLSVAGRSAARERAARVLSEDAVQLGTAPAWLADGVVEAMFTAGEVDASLARAIGHRLVTPDATGLRLYGLGLATPEKAYRRIESLLPRESLRARWFVESIKERSARLRFEAAPDADRSAPARFRSEEALCALRTGMLEAMPGLFGLLPAEVRHTACRAQGSKACRYDVRWQTSSRSATIAGLAIGLGVGTGLVSSCLWLGGLSLLGTGSLGAAVVAAFLALLVGSSIGRVVDLERQLQAVAGARRGHLALFDQVDDALAAKLDALARADAKLDSVVPVGRVRRPAIESVAGGVSPENQRGILAAAEQIHRVAGDLECAFEARREKAEADPGSGTPISDERGQVREIREWAARIGTLGSPNGEGFRARVDLKALVGRAIATARPSLPPTAVIRVEVDPDLRPIECEPVQIEHLVVQLVRNAVEASVGLSQAPEVIVRLANRTPGVELAVEDRGVGIQSSEIDEVFDPFFGERPVGSRGGLGLTVCLRIIERHAGELRIENENRAGTRVSVWLPECAEEEGE